MIELSPETKKHLHSQLIKLGDMMGDGLHLEADGRWISKEYKQTLRALGMLPKKKNNSVAINEAMTKRVNDVKCGKCEHQLKQTRSGSKRAICSNCGGKWQLLK